MKLLADGGSTKVDWRLIDNSGEVAKAVTFGMNPFIRSKEEISGEIGKVLVPAIKEYIQEIESVHFFGAGCTPEKSVVVIGAIEDHLSGTAVEVGSDMIAAARGLCGCKPGIVGIMGTGSNSGEWDGEKIAKQVSGLGYILGDEGSGSELGRVFVALCLKNQFGLGIQESFLSEYGLTKQDILDNVYRQPMPNRFLASFAPFILKHLDDEVIYEFTFKSFYDYFKHNICQYDYKNLPINLTGSVAFHFEKIVRAAATKMGMEVHQIVASPMEGLIEYYKGL